MLMKQITNHLIEIGYLNAGSNFRNAAFRKTARNKYLFSEEINVWYPALSLKNSRGLPERLSVFREKLTGSERSSFRNTVWNAAKVLSKNVPDVWNRLAAGSV